MAEGMSQSPAVSLPDVYASGIPYPPIDTLVEDLVDVDSSTTTVDVPDTLCCPCGTNGPCVPHRLPIDLSTYAAPCLLSARSPEEPVDPKNFAIICMPCLKMALGGELMFYL